MHNKLFSIHIYILYNFSGNFSFYKLCLIDRFILYNELIVQGSYNVIEQIQKSSLSY